MRIEQSTKQWPKEHTDFFEAYIALFRNSDTSVIYETLQDDYAGFLNHHIMTQCYARVYSIRKGKTPLFNRWQSLRLDEDGREI